MQSDNPPTPKQKPRWFYPTPGRLLVVLLAVEGILLLSEPWFPKGWAVLLALVAVGMFMLLMLLWLDLYLRFHWPFQFSIRSLLLLMVAIAVPAHWLAVELEAAKEQKAIADLANVSRSNYEEMCGKLIIPPAPEWICQLLGEDFFTYVVELSFSDEKVNVTLLKRLKALKKLRELNLAYTSISDAELEYLWGMNQLENLSWQNTKVTDAGIATLQKALPNCEIIH